MRAPVSASSWLKRTSSERVADTRRTGTVTRPKLMDPVQIALGTPSLLVASCGATTFAGRGAADQATRARSGTPCQFHPSRRRRAPPPAHQPRQGPLPGGGVQQGRGGRLLRAGGLRAPAPPPRPTPHHGPVAGRRRRGAVLREALPGSPPRVV